MLLYCLRHGESAFNAEGRVQGQLDVPLSEFGLRQSATLAGAFVGQPIEAIYCSPLKRALQTAQPIADALRLPIQTDDRLKEIHAGVFQGLVWSEIVAQYPAESVRWKNQEFDFTIPGGESRRQLVDRGVSIFREIREQGHRQVVIVSHGGLLAAALKGLLQIPPALNPFRFYNTALTKLEWEAQLKILYVNQLEHLRAAGIERESRTGDL